MTISPKILTESQVEDWIDANAQGRGVQHVPRLARFWGEAQSGARLIWTVRDEGRFAGHITLQPASEYPSFKASRIPEIVDLWVDPSFRRRGFGERLLLRAVEEARLLRAPAIGLGVGVTRDFGPAHRLYARHGFAPDGMGLWSHGRQTNAGDVVTLDEYSLLMLIKRL